MAKPSSVSSLLPLALLLFALAVLTVISVLLQPRNLEKDAIINRSIYNSAPSGLRAWALASQKAGLSAQRWEKPFSELDGLPSPATMLIVQPFTYTHTGVTYAKPESQTLLDWVAKGNTLILLDDFNRAGSRALIHKLKLYVTQAHVKKVNVEKVQKVKKTQKDAPTERILSLAEPQPALNRFLTGPIRSRNQQYFMTASKPEARPILEQAPRQPVLIRLPYQKGTLILGTVSDLAENQWLHENSDSNFQFLSNLIQAEQKPLYINEFVHGHNRLGDIFAYFREKTPIGAMMMQLFFVFLLVLWLSFTRWTPLIRPESSRIKANGFRQFIDSLASVYHRRQAASLAIRPQLAQLQMTLQKRHQVTLEEPAKIQALLQELPEPYSSSEATRLLARFQEAQALVAPDAENTLPNRELLQLSRQLSEIQERLRHVQR